MEKSLKIAADVLLTIITSIVFYIFFVNLKSLLSLDILFAFDPKTLNILIFTSVFGAFAFFFLIYEFLVSKYKPTIIFVPLMFIISQNFAPVSFIGALVIGLAVFLFDRGFFSDMNNFKKPSIARCFSSSINFPTTLICLAIVGALYPMLYSFIFADKVEIKNEWLNGITSLSSELGNSQLKGDETVRSLVINTLKKQNAPLTNENIEKAVDQVKTQFDVEVDENEKIADIYKRTISTKVEQLIEKNRTLSLIVILVTFYFIVSTLVKIAQIFSELFVLGTEKILLLSGVRLYRIEDETKVLKKEDSEENKPENPNEVANPFMRRMM